MKKFQTGFTLIEVMIVVAIIGIIVSIAAPAIMGMPNESKQFEPAQMQVPPPPAPTCVQGFLFTADGKQVVNANGGGVSCLQ